MIGEIAAIGYHNRTYEAASASGSPYRKMLSALWRESPLPLLEDGQQLTTMAALLHVDSAGKSMVSALIERSGLAPEDWLRRYFEAYLVPLVHCLYSYELAFMPHGENVILVLEDGVPVRAIMKDIAEEIVVMGDRLDLPEEVSRGSGRTSPTAKRCWPSSPTFSTASSASSRHCSTTTGRFRRKPSGVPPPTPSGTTRHSTPELAGQFARHDLFAADFELSCLNRLQLRNNQQMLDLTDPSGGLQMAGRLANPLARFAGEPRRSRGNDGAKRGSGG